MRTLGNILWLLICGLVLGLSWCISGIIWCATIVGIPIGVQSFKFAALAFWPFGREVVFGGGTVSALVNILWLIFGGLMQAAVAAMFGVVLCITIIGIPFGKQCFKLAKLSLLPFGATVVKTH